jgi:serine/threonine protein kinase
MELTRGNESNGAQPGEYAAGLRVPGTGYVVNRVLGRGGQSTVYEVENGIGKRFVLKAIRPHLVAPEFTRQLVEEAQVLVKLDHRNIVTAYELGTTKETPPRVFITMERLQGKTAKQLLRRAGRLELASALEVGISVAEALAHAHAHGIVHLDVKPDNIFLHVHPDGTHVVKLLDFGFMRALDGHGQTLSLAGTPGYGAPEQFLKEPVSARTDLYALGLVLYEMIAGRRPFESNGDVLSAVAARVSRPPPPLSTWTPVSPRVEQVVMACLELRPELRPPGATAVARELREARHLILRSRRGSAALLTVASLTGLAGDTPSRLRDSSRHSSRSAETADALTKTIASAHRTLAPRSSERSIHAREPTRGEQTAQSTIIPPPTRLRRGPRIAALALLIVAAIFVAVVCARRPALSGHPTVPTLAATVIVAPTSASATPSAPGNSAALKRDVAPRVGAPSTLRPHTDTPK